MVTFVFVSRHHIDQIAQAFTVAKLPEYHYKQMIPTGKMFHVSVAFIFPNKMVEMVSIQEFDEL